MNSSKVQIVSKDGCKYCSKAKEFLSRKNVPFEVEKLDPMVKGYLERREELVNQTGQTTFPWIFIGEEFIGGYSELMHAFNTFVLHDKLKAIGIELEMEDF